MCAKFTKRTILVADDDIISFKILSFIIERLGACAVWVKNGLEAIEMVRNNHNLNLIFMDIDMPVLDGIEATSKIKEINNDLPVIILTSDYYKKNASIKAGCDDFITKPIHASNITKILQKYLG